MPYPKHGLRRLYFYCYKASTRRPRVSAGGFCFKGSVPTHARPTKTTVPYQPMNVPTVSVAPRETSPKAAEGEKRGNGEP